MTFVEAERIANAAGFSIVLERGRFRLRAAEGRLIGRFRTWHELGELLKVLRP